MRAIAVIVAVCAAAAGWVGCATVPAGSGSGVSPSRPARSQPRARPAAAAPAALPRVMVLIDEKNLGTIATSEVESLLTARLLSFTSE